MTHHRVNNAISRAPNIWMFAKTCQSVSELPLSNHIAGATTLHKVTSVNKMSK